MRAQTALQHLCSDVLSTDVRCQHTSARLDRWSWLQRIIGGADLKACKQEQTTVNWCTVLAIASLLGAFISIHAVEARDCKGVLMHTDPESPTLRSCTSRWSNSGQCLRIAGSMLCCRA